MNLSLFYCSIVFELWNINQQVLYNTTMRDLYHPPRKEISLASVLYALSDPIRLQIIRQLVSHDEVFCGQLGKAFPKSTMSHHFKALREAGVTRTRIEGTQRFISLRREDLDARFPGLIDALLKASGPL